MSNIKKSWKTSLTAVATLLLGVSVFVMWWFGNIEVEGLAIGLVAVLYFSNLVSGLLTKDADQTHSKTKFTEDTGGDLPIKDDEEVDA